jgi:hypothetical protein
LMETVSFHPIPLLLFDDDRSHNCRCTAELPQTRSRSLQYIDQTRWACL